MLQVHRGVLKQCFVKRVSVRLAPYTARVYCEALQ